MSAQLGPEGVRVWRGDEIESLHVVVAAIVAAGGRLVARHGDPSRRAWIRSSAKPIQLVPLVEEGLVERYGLSDEELAVMAASHSAEPIHLRAVRGILAKAGLDEGLLRCGPHEPLSEDAAEELRRRGERPQAIHNNCSGKHAGMLLVCRAMGWPLETYVEPGHPLQLRIWSTLAELAGMDRADIGRAIDGCGSVVFAMPVQAMARAWSSLAEGDARRETDRQKAIGRILDAMTSHPELVAGTGRIDTDVMRRAGERVVVKTGAEGVFCAALRDCGAGPPRGLALKVVDGGKRAQDVALLAFLDALGVVDAAADPVLEDHARPILKNHSDAVVGRLDALLRLEPPPPPTAHVPHLTVELATAIVRLGAAAASGDPERLVGALERAGSLESDDIEEFLLQTYLFAGFPRTINAFFTWQGWAARDGRARGERRVEDRDPHELRSRGEALFRRVYGDDYEALRIRLQRLHPEIAAWTLVEGYGKVLGRPGPPGPDRRELAAVGALVALDAGRQLASHLRGAIHVGVPREILVPAVRRVATEWRKAAEVEVLLAALDPESEAGSD